jgi:hypothetical protein
MERLKAEKRRFEYRERTLLGFVSNAIRLIRPSMERTGKGLLPMLFALLVSGKQRRELMLAKEALAKKALSEKQFGKRKVRADRVCLVRDAQLATLAKAFDIQKQALDQRHAQEIATQKAEWQALSTERKRLWAQWEAEFGPRQTQRQGQGSGSSSGDRQAPSRPHRNFAETAAVKKETRAGRREADQTKIRGQGRAETRGFSQALATAAKRRGTENGWELQATAEAAQTKNVALRRLVYDSPSQLVGKATVTCPINPAARVPWPLRPTLPLKSASG